MTGYGIGAPPSGGGGGTSTGLGNAPKGATIAKDASELPVWVPSGAAQVQDRLPAYTKADIYAQAPTNLQDIQSLQQQLVAAGLLSPKGVIYGSWDPASQTAFSKLLAMSNVQQTEWQTTLATRLALVSSQTANQPAIGSSAPLTIQLTNPEDIKAAANNAAQTLHGTYLTPEQQDAFVASFQAQEAAAQQQAYNQNPGYNSAAGGYTGPGGTTVAPPNATTAAADEIRKLHPEEVAQNGFLSQLGTIVSALTGSQNGIA